jgi:hypothetical protein
MPLNLFVFNILLFSLQKSYHSLPYGGLKYNQWQSL